MPECKFGMNDKLMLENESKAKKSGHRKGAGIAIDDVSFHRCVQLHAFETDRTINFVPPDGEFELMKYRVTQNIILPFSVEPLITETTTSVNYIIKINGMFSHKISAKDVILKIPTPPNTAKCSISKLSAGKAKYNPSQNAIFWKIKKFPGDAKYPLTVDIKRLTGMSSEPWSRPPITVDFQVGLAASGLAIRFLKVFEASNYETVKWVRYMTRAGQYQIRI